ncbi:MAG: aminotransferase class III-fold pyridoxal phosphate-dependent enzyme [Candidatus Lernaella stagnicola]|nr:aminotransferase class III-fold pyridoxal phosphate-dependent enzyme [Candidatus Lernaella stagnicola]
MATKKTTQKTKKAAVKKPAAKKKAAPKKPAVKKAAAKKKAAPPSPSFQKSEELFLRVAKVAPGAIYGHQSPALTVPGSFPYFATHGKGAYYWDVDGNRYIDYLCAYGPMVTGYANPVVEKAAQAELNGGNCFNHPSELLVLMAEKLVDLIPFADWAVFAKNGSDVTTWATRVAREHTGRRKIVMVRSEYHGAHAWCDPGHGGQIPEDRAHNLYFTWNRLDELQSLFAKHGDDIAGVIMTPFHHPAFADLELPAPGFWQGVRKMCDDHGTVLILDDVRCGFRLDLRGSNYYFGFEPDISCYCKAIANGYPLSAAVGRNELKNAASRVFLTGSYWNSVASMAAALVNIDYLAKIDGIAKMAHIGQMLMDGLVERGKAFGYEMKPTGPPAIPFIRFAKENNFMRFQVFCSEMVKRGHFFHPHHNWFMSTAHTDKDVNKTLAASEEAFAIVKKQFAD